MSIEVPPDWTSDALSEFCDTALRNGLAFFERRRAEYERLRDIDAAFLTLSGSPPLGLGAFFLVRAHGALRGAVRMATSGQIPETYTLLRSALEWSMYASHVQGNDAVAQVWLRRHDGEAPDGSATEESESARRLVRNEFTVGRVMESLGTRSADVKARTKQLYEHAIDSGAHPNERALTGSMRREQEGTFEIAQIVADDSIAMKLAVKRTCQVGVCSLDIFQLLWHDQFEQLGLDTTMGVLRLGL